jgi:NADPH-dependent 2,4-dienoyl-CoA reductase/sulfur reductase-like enzyme/rhodanese-related sulfurtransferase
MKIVIVGGVAGGMSAAARARRLSEDAEIVVVEKDDYVSFANCGLPYHVADEIPRRADLLVQTPGSLRAALALDVRTGTEAIAIDRVNRSLRVRDPDGEYDLPYDALVLAPGARAIRPAIPGIDSPLVQTLRTVPDADSVRALVEAGARRAVVLGAGYIGVEAAEALRARDLDVTLVDLAPHVLPPFEDELASLVHGELLSHGVDVRTGVSATAIEQPVPEEDDGPAGQTDHVEVLLSDGSRVPADLVLLSVGVRPASSLAADAGLDVGPTGAIRVDSSLRTSDPAIWAVGDAIEVTNAVTGAHGPVPLAGPANRQGRAAADAILGRRRAGRAGVIGTAAPQSPGVLGTAIVRVFGLTAAMTGPNRAALRAAGIDHHVVHVHPNHHAGYFPGAQQVHLVLNVGTDGRVLGAQAVGAEGVDKRIDVIATAIRAGLSVDDLADLELAYAPPYGSAKDPVNMAGFVAQNVLEGTLRLWYPWDLDEVLDDALVLDVRSPAEYASGHLPGALNVPHTKVRERLEEIRAAAGGRPVRVHCASGVRSYLAHRVLTAAGLDSANLSGGLLTLRAARPDLALEQGARTVATTAA